MYCPKGGQLERAGTIPKPFEDSPQVSQEVTSQSKNGFRRPSREILINHLLNFPRLFVDANVYLLDVLASEVEHQRFIRDQISQDKKEKVTGDGSTVVAFPGLGTWRSLYRDPKSYFERSGFRFAIYFPGSANIGQIDLLYEGSKKFLIEQAEDSKSKVHLVGHSLGAYIIRVMANEDPELLSNTVRDIFLVGAPANGRINSVVETIFLLSQLPYKSDQIDTFIGKFRNLPERVAVDGVNVYEIESQFDLIVKNLNGKVQGKSATFESAHSALLRDPDVLGYITERFAA